jgi:TolB protein
MKNHIKLNFGVLSREAINGEKRMTKSKMALITLVMIILLFTANTAHAKVYLDIFGKSFKKITVGVPPFKGDKIDRSRMDMSELLNKDLDMSGFFIVAPQSLMDKELTDEGTEKQEIKFSNWKSIGIELLCKGKIQKIDGDLVLEAFVYDTLDGALILAKRYKTKTEDWRKIVHRLADDIMLAITGEKGIMSSKIVFVSGGRNRKDIYMADIDGANQKKLTNYRSITLSPSISPNGRYLAYTSYREGRPNLYITDIDNSRELFTDKSDGMKTGTTWIGASTFGYSHTLGRYSTIYALNVENKDKKTVQRNDGIATSPSFSPDGSKMVFVSDMHGSPQVFIKDLPSGTPKRLTYSGTYNTSPVLSPKGDLIAFVAKFEGAFEICTMNIDGSNQRVLTVGGINDSPQFSPCGRYIIYSSNKGGKYNIYLMLFNGESKKMLKFSDGEETQPKFAP